jgi:hypothetical protein
MTRTICGYGKECVPLSFGDSVFYYIPGYGGADGSSGYAFVAGEMAYSDSGEVVLLVDVAQIGMPIAAAHCRLAAVGDFSDSVKPFRDRYLKAFPAALKPLGEDGSKRRSPRERFNDVMSRVSYPGFRFFVSDDYLQIQCLSTCNHTGKPLDWTGRKWRLSEHMSDGEVVQTAFKAVLTALEHEARELFTYRQVSVFDPHYDIEKLVELRQQPDAIKERAAHA